MSGRWSQAGEVVGLYANDVDVEDALVREVD